MSNLTFEHGHRSVPPSQHHANLPQYELRLKTRKERASNWKSGRTHHPRPLGWRLRSTSLASRARPSGSLSPGFSKDSHARR